jgi:hypothetical protein
MIETDINITVLKQFKICIRKFDTSSTYYVHNSYVETYFYIEFLIFYIKNIVRTINEFDVDGFQIITKIK